MVQASAPILNSTKCEVPECQLRIADVTQTSFEDRC